MPFKGGTAAVRTSYARDFARFRTYVVAQERACLQRLCGDDLRVTVGVLGDGNGL